MKVVAPKGSNVGYFKRNGILHTAPLVKGKLDLGGYAIVDFLDDDTDWEEAMTALEILEQDEMGTEYNLND